MKNSRKHNTECSLKRRDQVNSGAFDGRFAPRVVSDKKKYDKKKERQMKFSW